MAQPDSPQPRLDATDATFEAFQKIREKYQAPRQSYNALIYGFAGKGKTTLLRTVRFPLIVYQFDPNGSAPLADLIAEGKIIVADFSQDDPTNPTAYKRFCKLFKEHRTSGLFDHVGSIAIDSLTMWAHAMMISILKANGRMFNDENPILYHGKLTGGQQGAAVPDMRDYGVQLNTVTNFMGLFTAIPCDTFLLAHAKEITDEVTDRTTYEPMLSGQQRATVPILFDEVYIADTKTDANGTKFILRTQPNGRWTVARSRLSGLNNLLAPTEPQNIKAILKKVGRDAEDLPIPKLG